MTESAAPPICQTCRDLPVVEGYDLTIFKCPMCGLVMKIIDKGTIVGFRMLGDLHVTANLTGPVHHSR